MKVVIDASNMVHRAYRGTSQNQLSEDSAALALHTVFTGMHKYFQRFKDAEIITVFDLGKSWRYHYTMSESCVSGNVYKSNRRQAMTSLEQKLYAELTGCINDFYSLLSQHTSIPTLGVDGLEADDIIAGLCEIMDDDIVIISSDKDFIQLLRYPNVKLLDPLQDKYRNLDEWEGSADLFMTCKAFKGDPGDFVMSAYPRIRKTKIVKAMSDPVMWTNIMQETWVKPDARDVTGFKTVRVGDLYSENMLLMDLTKQPNEIKIQCYTHIDAELNRQKQFNYLQFMKFLGRHGLDAVADKASTYLPMLSAKNKVAKVELLPDDLLTY